MDDVLKLWREFEKHRSTFEQHQNEVFAPIKEQIARLVAEQHRNAQGAIELQEVLLGRLRRRLAQDARVLLPTKAFKKWLQDLLVPDKQGKKHCFVPDNVALWELASQPLPLGLHGIERIEQQGYNDEQHFLSELLVVGASLGEDRFHIGFETSQIFVFHRREKASLAEQIEYTPYEIEDHDGGLRTSWGRRSSRRTTWHMLKGHQHQKLGLQIFTLARFAVPMLEATPRRPAFSYP